MNYSDAIKEMIEMLEMGINMGFYSDKECGIIEECISAVYDLIEESEDEK